MKRKLLVPGALLFACAGAHADSAVTLSGFVDLNIEHLISSGPASVTRMTSGGLNNSRFNLSGVEDLGGGNKAVFTIEPMFSADTGVQSPQFRQSFVGLKSASLGEVTLGRQFTPSYWIAGYADPSWAAAFSMVNNMEFFYASYRVDNAIQYKTPTLYGITGRVMYAFGAEDSTRAGRFLSVGVDYRNGPLFLGAVSEQQYTRNIFQPAQIPSSRDNYFSAAYRFGGFEPTAIFHTYNGYYAYPPYVAFSSSGWDAQLGARWNIDGRNRVYASVVHRHDDNNKSITSATGFVVGYLYGMSRRTDLYATYAHIQNQNKVPIAYPVTWSSNPSPGQDPSGFQLGIRHAF